MEQPLYTLTSSVNRHNHARCEVYADRVVLSTACDGGLFPVYENAERVIPIADLEKVVVSRGGVRLFAHHPNCIHFVVRGARRTVDQMYRDRAFHASDYLGEGVFQLAPKSEAELEEKLGVARDIRRYIESVLGDDSVKD